MVIQIVLAKSRFKWQIITCGVNETHLYQLKKYPVSFIITTSKLIGFLLWF